MANLGMKAFQAEAPDRHQTRQAPDQTGTRQHHEGIQTEMLTKTFKLPILEGFTLYCINIYDQICSIMRFTNTIPRVSQYGANQATYAVLEVCQSE